MLQTKRLVIGHVTVCSGCCCGAVGRGKPEVPVEWLKREWRSRGLLKNIQLTISCCLGPCDLTNVVKVAGPATDVWLGNLHRFDQYASLVDWAAESKAAGVLSPLPDSFAPHRFNPFGQEADAAAEK
jgi:hypothetical protein